MLVADLQSPERTRVKVLDFGLAKLAMPGGSPFFKTSNNSILGTPLYMSPEQCAGAGKVDAQSDVYSLGCLLYETLSGRPPFMAEGLGQLLGMHMYDPPEPLGRLAPRLPKPVMQLVHAMLSKEKERRPVMSEVAKKLSELQRLVPITKPDPSGPQQVPNRDAPKSLPFEATLAQVPGEPQGRMRPRMIRRVLAGIACVAMILCGVIYYLRPPKTTSAEAPQPMRVDRTADSARAVGQPLAAAGPDAGVSRSVVIKRIQVQIETDPKDAEVTSLADGKVLGTTPWHSEQQAQNATLDVRLHRAGFANKELHLDLSQDATYREQLTPLSVKRPASAPNRKQRAASSAERHTGHSPPSTAGGPLVKESIPLED